MTGDEDEPQEIIPYVVIDGGIEIRLDTMSLGYFPAKFLVLAVADLAAAKMVDGSMFCSGHEPGAGIIRNSRSGPLL